MRFRTTLESQAQHERTKLDGEGQVQGETKQLGVSSFFEVMLLPAIKGSAPTLIRSICSLTCNHLIRIVCSDVTIGHSTNLEGAQEQADDRIRWNNRLRKLRRKRQGEDLLFSEEHDDDQHRKSCWTVSREHSL